MEKKLTEKVTVPEVTESRRQQLKEILAKQAELGCEVAEIPSYYLSDSEKQGHGREQNKWAFNKKEKFQNKFNKRGRFRQNDRFAKKQRSADNSSNVYDENHQFTKKQKLANNDSSGRPTLNEREPTLLQKLLSADIKREKSHLLQVFRFMVMNSFFKEWPEKPLSFPLVIVNEAGNKGELVEENSLHVEKGAIDSSDKAVVEESEAVVEESDDDDTDDDHNHHDDNDETGAEAKAASNFGREKGSTREEIEGPEEEEGEIID